MQSRNPRFSAVLWRGLGQINAAACGIGIGAFLGRCLQLQTGPLQTAQQPGVTLPSLVIPDREAQRFLLSDHHQQALGAGDADTGGSARTDPRLHALGDESYALSSSCSASHLACRTISTSTARVSCGLATSWKKLMRVPFKEALTKPAFFCVLNG